MENQQKNGFLVEIESRPKIGDCYIAYTNDYLLASHNIAEIMCWTMQKVIQTFIKIKPEIIEIENLSLILPEPEAPETPEEYLNYANFLYLKQMFLNEKVRACSFKADVYKIKKCGEYLQRYLPVHFYSIKK